QHANQKGGESHGGEREHQRAFAANAVSEVAEQRRADGTREERNSKGREREENGRRGVWFGEEKRREDQDRGRGIDVEIEEFDGGADEGSKENLLRSVDLA